MKKGVLALLSMGHLVTDLSQGMVPFLIPFLQDKFQLSYFLVGIIVLVSNLSSSFIQPIFGYISDKVPMRWIIPVGCLVANGGMALAGVSPKLYFVTGSVYRWPGSGPLGKKDGYHGVHALDTAFFVTVA